MSDEIKSKYSYKYIARDFGIDLRRVVALVPREEGGNVLDVYLDSGQHICLSFLREEPMARLLAAWVALK